MKTRYRLTRRGIRGNKFYCVDTTTGKRTSLRTTNEEEARQIVEARNQSERQPVLNLQIAKPVMHDVRLGHQLFNRLNKRFPHVHRHRFHRRLLLRTEGFPQLISRLTGAFLHPLQYPRLIQVP